MIARELIRRAADATLRERVGPIAAEDVVIWFDEGSALQVSDDAGVATALAGFSTVPGLLDEVRRAGLGGADDGDLLAGCELVLESLVARRKLTRSESGQYRRSVRRKPGMSSERPEGDE